jgi:hypothetical protein
LKKFCLALFAIKTANARHLKVLLLFEIIIELKHKPKKILIFYNSILNWND